MASAQSPCTVERITGQRFLYEREEIIRALSLVKELLLLAEEDGFPAMQQFVDLEQHLIHLRPINAVLDLEEVQDIRRVLLNHHAIQSVFKDATRQEQFPFLYQTFSRLDAGGGLLKEIHAVLDEDGSVRDDASPELIQIRKKQKKLVGAISSSFNQAMKKYASHLIDSQESYKNGRRVLAVRSESKREIRGLIHDESTTGKTVFIEPEEVILLNQQVYALEAEERKEIFKIIQMLCVHLRDNTPLIEQALADSIEMDFLVVKSKLSREIDGVMPEVLAQPHMEWLEARHPILLRKNNELNKETIASDFTLFGKNRILLISGPNAGGKSIALKTCALLQCMVQYGILVPCGEMSKAGIFNKIMVDIGDQQSIENDLSTYSSRLKKMREMMEQVNDKSLIFIDEFGSGTDPTTGGALAEAMLREFLRLKTYGVITTHYSNLKVFAFKNFGIVNGAMNFDEKALTPTYKLTIGKPGSSFAFEIAQKMKLPSQVIKNAKKRLGGKKVKVEDLLVSIQSEKNQLESEREKIKEKEEKLDRLVKTYNDLQGQLEYRRKKLKLETKERKLSQEAEFNRQLENTIRQLREEKNIEEAKSISAKQKEKKKDLREEVNELQTELFDLDKNDQPELKRGDFVRMKNGTVTGEIEDLQKNQARVIFGGMQMNVPVTDLIKANEPIPVKSRSSIYTQVQQKATTFKSKIDIRGLKMEDAREIIQTFLDEALVAGVSRLEILHGKGSGVLRRVVRDKAKEYSQVSGITHPDPDKGGEGISIVHIE